MNLQGRVRPALLTLGLAAASAACGGGGGGGGTGPVPARPTPSVPGFTAPQGAITLVPASGGSLGSALLASSNDGVLLAQAASTPSQPASGSALTTYTVTVKENAGTTPSSYRRETSTREALAQRIAENHALMQADGIRERAQEPAVLRQRFAGIGWNRARALEGARRPRAAAGSLGTVRPFKILTSNIGNSGGCTGGTTSGTYECNTTITATLEAVGAHGNVWVDNASLATAGEFSNVPGEFQTIAAAFDQYYAIETAAFGPAWFASTMPVTPTYSQARGQCDASGNVLPQNQWVSVDFTGASGTSVDIVITDALAGTGEGGYYATGNEFPQEVWNCATAPKPVSNDTSMVVIAGNNYTPGTNLSQFNESFWLHTDVPRGLSHELQHLLHAHNKVVYPLLTGGSITFDDSFIDEGCSMLAEDLAADGIHIDTPRYTYTYLLEPSLFSLTAFTGFQPNPTTTASAPPYGWYSNTAGSYGQAYLLLRYLYDRFGPNTLKAIYASTASGVGPAVAAAGNEPFGQLYLEFVTAIAVQNTPAASGPYGFSSAIVLRGNAQVPSRRTGSQSTRYFTFGGPQSPELFASNQPSGFLTLVPGTTGSTFIVDGGTLFLPAANGSAGAAIMVTGSKAPSFQGAIVQGVLPTPVPAST